MNFGCFCFIYYKLELHTNSYNSFRNAWNDSFERYEKNPLYTAGLAALEDEKREIERELRLLNEKIDMDEFPVDLLYRACDEAKKALRSGKLPEIKQVLNLYLRRVTVEREHIEVELNVVPSFTWNGLPIKLPLMRYEPEEAERNITDGTKFRVLKHSLWHHNVESGYKINTDKYERY